MTLPFCWQISSRSFYSVIFNDFSSILESVVYRRKSSLESEERKLKQSVYDNQHIDGNAENHEWEMLTSPMEKNKNITYQLEGTCVKTLTPK